MNGIRGRKEMDKKYVTIQYQKILSSSAMLLPLD